MKVSIIVPIYNGERYIRNCLDSLLQQSLDEYEIICINDGSTDNSQSILNDYAKRYPNSIKVYHTSNKGVWYARELGIQKANGQYIGFCDCDDKVSADMYKILYDKITSTHSDMAVCAYQRIDYLTNKILCIEMNRFGEQILSVQNNINILGIINTSLWNKMIKRDVLIKHIQFYNPPRIAEDMMLLLSIYPFMKRITFCDKPLYFYYIYNSSAMSKIQANELDHLMECMVQTKSYILNSFGTLWEPIITLFAFIHFGISILFRINLTDSNNFRLSYYKIKRWLNENFVIRNQFSYLRLNFKCSYNCLLLKPTIFLWIYKLGLFPIAIKCYCFLIKHIPIDIKW